MLKHSSKDSWLILLSLVQLLLLSLPFLVDLSGLALLGLTLLNVFLIGTNYQCVSHNFIHLPFFKSERLNQFFSVLNTINLGVPQSAYRIHHLQHHRYNNHPEYDESSTYRFGRNGKEENIIRYSVLGVFRSDLASLIRKASEKNSLVWIEIIGLVLFIAFCVFLNYELVILYLLPLYFLGQVFALWENYCEHHHANHSDRRRDSVSCYNRFYNFIWFNNGYHQEHHYAPQVHWTKIKEIRSELPKDRVVVSGCHLWNSF
jgi:fatty acid desaturase